MEMEKEVKILNLDDILPNRFQPRIKFNESAILELAESIKEHGVIQPIVVRKISDKYEIIAGERRYKASLLAGKTTIPAVITTLDDKNSAEIALIENVQRQDLTPIEEAISYKKILDMGYLNQTELAEKLGKTQSTIANKLRLLNLSEDVQEALLEQKISERHARSLLKLQEDQQPAMLDRIINERLTVRKTDEEIKKILDGDTSDGDTSLQKEASPYLSNTFEITNETTEEKAKVNELPVEILDLEGNEEEKMNEELNIPMEKIIEPLEDTTPSLDVWTISEDPVEEILPVSPVNIDISNENIVDPGFVDVTKIENEAQDIFKPQQEPADISMLLQASPKQEPELESPMAPVTPDVSPTETFSQTSTGKFFNIFNTPVPTATEDLEQKQTNMDFGEPKINNTFMFNFNPLEESSIQSPTVETQNQMEQTSSDVFNIPSEASIPEVLESEVSTVEQPNSYATDFTSFSNESASDSSIGDIFPKTEDMTIKPLQATESFNSVYPFVKAEPVTEEQSNESFVPSTQDSIFTPNMNNQQVDDNVFYPNMFAQSEENEFEPFNPYSLNENNEFTKDNELDNYKFEDDFETSIGASISQSSPVSSPVAVTDIRTVINTIRECAKTLEKYGFEVELDELDFPDSYQANFKVTKKED